MKLQGWVFPQRFFRENLKLGDGGENGPDNSLLEKTFDRTGVSVMGKRMFDGGERGWHEEAPFSTPVFVLTHEVGEDEGETGWHHLSLRERRDRERPEASACRPGWQGHSGAGGADTIVRYLNAGLIDEFSIALAPVLLGEGVRLFEGVDHKRAALEIADAFHSPLVTHLRYVVQEDQIGRSDGAPDATTTG